MRTMTRCGVLAAVVVVALATANSRALQGGGQGDGQEPPIPRVGATVAGFVHVKLNTDVRIAVELEGFSYDPRRAPQFLPTGMSHTVTLTTPTQLVRIPIWDPRLMPGLGVEVTIRNETNETKCVAALREIDALAGQPAFLVNIGRDFDGQLYGSCDPSAIPVP